MEPAGPNLHSQALYDMGIMNFNRHCLGPPLRLDFRTGRERDREAPNPWLDQSSQEIATIAKQTGAPNIGILGIPAGLKTRSPGRESGAGTYPLLRDQDWR